MTKTDYFNQIILTFTRFMSNEECFILNKQNNARTPNYENNKRVKTKVK